MNGIKTRKTAVQVFSPQICWLTILQPTMFSATIKCRAWKVWRRSCKAQRTGKWPNRLGDHTILCLGAWEGAGCCSALVLGRLSCRSLSTLGVFSLIGCAVSASMVRNVKSVVVRNLLPARWKGRKRILAQARAGDLLQIHDRSTISVSILKLEDGKAELSPDTVFTEALAWTCNAFAGLLVLRTHLSGCQFSSDEQHVP